MLKLYFGTGKYIILDSGFCALKALTELKRHGIYACALIKKRCFGHQEFLGLPLTTTWQIGMSEK
jgi:hypothetical protein